MKPTVFRSRLALMAVLASAATLPAVAQDEAPKPAAPPAAPAALPRQNVDRTLPHPVATIETPKGRIRFELYPEDAPKTVENFINLAKKGYFDGIAFHRVVPGFVVQGGDPLTKTMTAGHPALGTGGPGYTIPDEKNKVLRHLVGAVAMAKTSAPNSAGSQFYIVITNPQPRLDQMGYTVFGQVIEGQDVAEKIAVGDRMTKVTITEPETKKKEGSAPAGGEQQQQQSTGK